MRVVNQANQVIVLSSGSRRIRLAHGRRRSTRFVVAQIYLFVDRGHLVLDLAAEQFDGGEDGGDGDPLSLNGGNGDIFTNNRPSFNEPHLSIFNDRSESLVIRLRAKETSLPAGKEAVIFGPPSTILVENTQAGVLMLDCQFD